MTKLLAYVLAAIASAGLLFAPNVCAAAQNSKEITEFALLDLILEIDPDVKGFSQDVAIELQDVKTGRKYQYVFRRSHNYIIPDNPIKVIANAAYTVKTYIRDATGVCVAGADGQEVTQIQITPDGAALVLFVKSSAAQSHAQAGTAQGPAQEGAQGGLSSLIPVMDRFYEKTSYDKNAGVDETYLKIWTKWDTNERRFLREPNHTAEQWKNFSLYQKANYMALTIIPFEVLFLYPSEHIDKNNKSSFTKSVYSSTEILKTASMDGGVYYDEICRVLDWEWDYYVQTSSFINVIDEYARLKAEGNNRSAMGNNEAASINQSGAKNGNPNVNAVDKADDKPNGGAVSNRNGNSNANANDNHNDNADGNHNDNADDNHNDNADGNVNDNHCANAADINAPANAAKTPENNAAGQSSRGSAAKTVQKDLIDKVLGNIIPIIVGTAALLIFFFIKKWNESHTFQSEEREDGEN